MSAIDFNDISELTCPHGPLGKSIAISFEFLGINLPKYKRLPPYLEPISTYIFLSCTELICDEITFNSKSVIAAGLNVVFILQFLVYLK